MKKQILKCEYCQEDTIHMLGKSQSLHRGTVRTNREWKHCCKCNKRTMRNSKFGRTYVK